MIEKLEQQLFEKYPKIFKDKDLDARYSCMAWGIGCPDSWYDLIDALCESLQWWTDKNSNHQVIAEQVKEKFGTLRFYYRTELTEDMALLMEPRIAESEGRIAGTVGVYEKMTGKICSTCGTNQNIECTKGWVRYVCKDCLIKEQNESKG